MKNDSTITPTTPAVVAMGERVERLQKEYHFLTSEKFWAQRCFPRKKPCSFLQTKKILSISPLSKLTIFPENKRTANLFCLGKNTLLGGYSWTKLRPPPNRTKPNLPSPPLSSHGTLILLRPSTQLTFLSPSSFVEQMSNAVSYIRGNPSKCFAARPRLLILDPPWGIFLFCTQSREREGEERGKSSGKQISI